MKSHRPDSGFTLLEVLVVLALVGVLAAIGGPAWLGFTRTQRLNAAQTTIFNALKRAQSEAKTGKVRYRVTFRQSSNGPEVAVYPAEQCDDPTGTPPLPPGCNDLPFRPLAEEGNKSVELGCVTPGYSIGSCAGANDPRNIIFDSKGNYSGLLNVSAVLRASTGGSQRRCVVVRNLLGAIDTLSQNSTGNACDDT